MLGLKGGATTLVDGSYWSLAVELAFYMLIGVFVAVFSFSNIRYFFTGWLSISFLVFFFDVQRYLLAEFTLARHAPYFIFGGFLALLMQNFSVSTLREKVIDITGMIFATLLAFYVMNYSLVSSYGVKDPKDFYYVTGFILLIFICVPFIVYYSKYVTNSRIIKLSMLCGGVTYPLYLLHQQIGKMIVHSFGAPRTFSLISILTACFMIVVSYYVYIYEKRVRKYLMIKLKVAKE
jgi:peptidoglycan/LPS O-acetylase OafA/YrhL